MQVTPEKQSGAMHPTKDFARQVQARRQRTGMNKIQFAQEAAISRDTLADLEAGNKKPQPETVTKVLSALDRLEEEMGLDAESIPPGVERIGDPADDLFAVKVYTDAGVLRAVVQGMPKDAETIQETALALIAGMNVTPPKANGA